MNSTFDFSALLSTSAPDEWGMAGRKLAEVVIEREAALVREQAEQREAGAVSWRDDRKRKHEDERLGVANPALIGVQVFCYRSHFLFTFTHMEYL